MADRNFATGGTLFLKPASTWIYDHRIPDAATSRALSGVHTPIVVIRESGLTVTIIVLELELEDKVRFTPIW